MTLPIRPVRVKICGLTRPEDVRAACELGVDALGFNFWPRSRRYLDPRSAIPVLSELSPLTAGVGVFVQTPFRRMYATAYQLGLRGVQWVGDDADFENSYPFSVVLAVRVRDGADLIAAKREVERAKSLGCTISALLIDGFAAGEMGGTGHKAPWEMLRDFDAGVPVILAGGLTPENVAEAIREVRPMAVDVASGVESAPGVKDAEKMRRFIDAARSA